MTTTICEKSFAADATYRNFYAGGDVEWTADGKLMYCLNTTEITVVEVVSGQVIKSYGTSENDVGKKQQEDEVDEDIIYAFALAASNEYFATAHRSGLLRLWSVETGQVLKLWKAQHKGPIVKLAFSPCGKLLCSSGADSCLRVWDFVQSRCLGVLKDFPGPALVISFHADSEQTQVYAAGADHSIYCYNYMTKELVRCLRGHISQVTAFSFDCKQSNEPLLASVSRDKVLIIWHLASGVQQKVIPMYEELEGVCFDEDKIIVACAKGSLKAINRKTWKISNLLDSSGCELKLLLQCKQNAQLALVTAEQNILIYETSEKAKLVCVKQLIGFNDEILDLSYLGANDRFLVVATNSQNLKIYDTAAEMNCKIVAGHKDTILTLSSCSTSNLLLTAGKDFSILLWELDVEHFDLKCIAENRSSHTSTIGSIAFAYNLDNTFASVCQDGSLKVWRLKKDPSSKVYSFHVKYSAVAHEKEINCVCYSPNNKMIATASQDKTAKLWSSESSACLGTLRGHARSVWCVRFSPVDQIVLTSSSDSSLRIWSLATLSCIKRFEQECSILRAEFIEHGKFVVSAGSDGLLKIWNVKTNVCVQTLDEHSERIWSLVVSARSKKYFYSGGADSKLIRWHDVTEQCRNEEIDKRQAMLQQEQALQTLLQQKQSMHKAFVLALKLGKPKVSFDIISNFVRLHDLAAIKNIITQLDMDECTTLLEHVKAWSTNSRHCKVSNLILNFILTDIIVNPEAARTYNTANMVEVLTPYVQRHFRRVTELNKELTFLEFIVKSI